MLRCQICAPTTISTDSSYLQPIATSNFVAWCIDYSTFRDGCSYVGPGYTTPFSSTALVDVSSHTLSIDPIIRTFDVSLSSPSVQTGVDAGQDGRIGAQVVNYSRLLYNERPDTSTTPTTSAADAAATAWWFADASFSLTLGFSADGSGIDVSYDPVSLGIFKQRNDAACDNVQIRTDASFALFGGGLHSASPDTIYTELDYASTLAQTLPANVPNPTLLIDDAVFTACVDEHSSSISSSSELHSALDDMMTQGKLCGLRSSDVSFVLACEIAGETRTSVMADLTPQIFFHGVV